MNQILDDIRNVWTAPAITASGVKAEGRSGSAFTALVIVAFAVFVAQTALGVAIGADVLPDQLFASGNSVSLSLRFYIALGLSLILMFFLNWLLLPAVSRLFGGSGLRSDANTTFYLMLCIGVGTTLLFAVSDVTAVVLQRIASPSGSYFSAASLVLLAALGILLSTVVTRTSQSLPGYGQALAVTFLSMLAAIVITVVAFALVYGAFVGF